MRLVIWPAFLCTLPRTWSSGIIKPVPTALLVRLRKALRRMASDLVPPTLDGTPPETQLTMSPVKSVARRTLRERIVVRSLPRRCSSLFMLS